MTKKELSAVVAEKMGMKKNATEAIVNCVFDELTEALLTEGEVSIAGLGKFKIKETEPRIGRNPRTGESLNIPASKKATFKYFDSLKTVVKGE